MVSLEKLDSDFFFLSVLSCCHSTKIPSTFISFVIPSSQNLHVDRAYAV